MHSVVTKPSAIQFRPPHKEPDNLRNKIVEAAKADDRSMNSWLIKAARNQLEADKLEAGKP